jgi:hypothetical protein
MDKDKNKNNEINNNNNNNNNQEIINKIITSIQNTEFNEKIKKHEEFINGLFTKIMTLATKKFNKISTKLFEEIQKKCILQKEKDLITITPQKGNEEICETLQKNITNLSEQMNYLILGAKQEFLFIENMTSNSLNECIKDGASVFLKDKNEENLETHIYNCFSFSDLFNIAAEHEIDEAIYNNLKEIMKKMI